MKPTIVYILSPGHNSKAVGACSGKTCEFPNTKTWVTAVERALTAMNRSVEIITAAGLTEKVKQVNGFVAKHKGKKCLAVEVHFNAGGSPTTKGCETLYCPGSVKGKAIATAYQSDFIKRIALATPNRGVKEGWYRMDVPGKVDFPGDVDGDEHKDYFLEKTACPALILEPCFITEVDTANKNLSFWTDAIAFSLIETENLL